MFLQIHSLGGTEDHGRRLRLKSRLVEGIVLFALTIGSGLPLFAQSPLAVEYLETQNMGGSAIMTNLQLKLEAGLYVPMLDFFDLQGYSNIFQFTTNDVGRMFTINEKTDTNFATLASILTNGEPDSIGVFYMAWVGTPMNGVGQGGSTYLYDAFAPLPAGNNGIDFRGFPINGVSILIDTLTFSSPGRNPNGNGRWTDVAFGGRLFVNGDPLLLSTNVSETAEVGDSISFPAFIASSGPLPWQWFLNGSNLISSGTNLLVSGTNYLQISNVQASNSGAYTLVVPNNSGSLTSAPMVLNVVPRVSQRPVPAVCLRSQPGSSWTVAYSDIIGLAAQWTPLAAVTLTNSSQYYFDVAGSLRTNRFYEAFQTNSPEVTSSLSLQVATAVTLTGNVGDSVLVDCIYPFAPTNAWQAVGTATLTNATQLYFDLTTIGLPPRIYRVTPVD